MNIKAIKKAAVAQYSQEDEGFVVRSMLLPDVIGVGDTEADAWKVFDELLQDHYDDWKAGRLAEKPSAGRPKKNKVKFAVEIAPDVKDAIAKYAAVMGCSQGEVVEFLYNFHEHTPEEYTIPDKSNPQNTPV